MPWLWGKKKGKTCEKSPRKPGGELVEGKGSGGQGKTWWCGVWDPLMERVPRQRGGCWSTRAPLSTGASPGLGSFGAQGGRRVGRGRHQAGFGGAGPGWDGSTGARATGLRAGT